MSPRLLPLVLLLTAPYALAAEVGADGTATTAPVANMVAITAGSTTPDLGSSALQMMLGLVVVLALLVGTLWLLKRISQPNGQVAGLMRVVAGVSVGPRERVVILELGNSWLVLGVSPGQVSTLAEIPRQEVPTSSQTLAGIDFSSWLKQVVQQRGKG